MDDLRPDDPRRIGRYRLLGRLGEGGMGRVFLGVSPGGRHVAVKLINPAHAGPHFRERFVREIEAARQVGGFHTAPVVDADPDADPPWMVTAYIHGPSLEDAVAERGPFGLDELCMLGAGLAEGLAAIHGCGLVHRDLKPSNVILAEDGPRIIDFGIARAATEGALTTVGTVVGTYSFMSPEHLSGEPVGPASDVFSLGCTLAFAATGRAPFGEDSIGAVVSRVISRPPDLKDATEERGFRQLLTECLAKSPDDRPALTDILSRLTEAAAGEEPAPGSTASSTPQQYTPTQTIHTDRPAPPPPDRPAKARAASRNRNRASAAPGAGPRAAACSSAPAPPLSPWPPQAWASCSPAAARPKPTKRRDGHHHV